MKTRPLVPRATQSPGNRDRMWAEAALYAGVVVATLAAAWSLLSLWGADLRIPLTYHADALWTLTSVRTMIDTGWVTNNPLLGAPGVQSMTAYPITEMLQLLILRLMVFFSRDAGVVVNLYYVLTYVLTAVTSLAVFRHLKVKPAPAAAGAILYAFLPYHILRGELHLGLSAYYVVPLSVLVALWAWSSRPPVFAPGGSSGAWAFVLTEPRTIAALAICLLTGLQGAYYAYFAAFFIFGAGAFGALMSKQWRRAVGPALLVCVIVVGVLVSVLPYVTAPDRGSVPNVTGRSPSDTVVLGLKLSDMILPAIGHRVAAFADIQARWTDALIAQNWLLNNESRTDSLGAVGVLGLLFLLGWLVFAAVRGERVGLKHGALLTRLSGFTYMGLLLAMDGGLGTLVSLFVYAQIRAYNRIVVFVAFFALFAVVLLLDTWFAKLGRGPVVAWSVVAVIVVVGLLDQVPTGAAPMQATALSRDAVVARFDSDESFVGSIEAAVPAGSAIFQLPYIPFPESGTTNGMADYEHFRGYLHSRSLRWSYGAIRQTEAARFAEATSKLSATEMVAELKRRGFAGVWVDAQGYEAAEGEALGAELASVLGNPVIIDDVKGRAFWAIP